MNRLVSGLERVWIAAGAMDPSFAQATVLRPERMPSIAAWQAAWRDLVAARPGLRLRAHGWGRRTRWAPTGTAPFEALDDDWDGTTDHPALRRPLHAFKGPTVRLIVSRHAAVLLAHHAVLDGRGCWQVARDLLATLDGRPPEARGLAPLDVEIARALDPPAFADPPPDQPRLLPGPVTSTPGWTWARRALPCPSQPLARVAQAIAQHADRPVRLGLPVDLRRHLDGPVGDGNLTGIAHLMVDPTASRSAIREAVQICLRERHAEAQVVAADQMRGVPLWLMRWAGNRSAARQQRQALAPVTATLSNLGRQPLQLDGAPVEAWFIPPYSRGMPLFVALVGDATRLQMVGVAPKAIGDGGRLETLLDALAKAITGASVTGIAE